jgi:hypothetical protein
MPSCAAGSQYTCLRLQAIGLGDDSGPTTLIGWKKIQPISVTNPESSASPIKQVEKCLPRRNGTTHFPQPNRMFKAMNAKKNKKGKERKK